MYDHVEAILKSLGLTQAYLKAFQDNEMNDESLTSCLEGNMDLFQVLEKIIPATGHRVKFITAFKTQQAKAPAGGAARQTLGLENNAMQHSAAAVQGYSFASMGKALADTGRGKNFGNPQGSLSTDPPNLSFAAFNPNVGPGSGDGFQGSRTASPTTFQGSGLQRSRNASPITFQGSGLQGPRDVPLTAFQGSVFQGSRDVQLTAFQGSSFQGPKDVPLPVYQGSSLQGPRDVPLSAFQCSDLQGPRIVPMPAFQGSCLQGPRDVPSNLFQGRSFPGPMDATPTAFQGSSYAFPQTGGGIFPGNFPAVENPVDGFYSRTTSDGFRGYGYSNQHPRAFSQSLAGPRSIQIMEFEQVSKGNKTRKVILFEHEFRQVIEKCDPRRPVAVLAIAGKANKGKSLFLSYVLRYLKAQQQGNPDWMGWNDTTAIPLDGFTWANGYEVVTKGIWTWSEPITCRNSRGQEFDILLMDTQGVFDEKTGQREWNILAGLGLLTSSVMVLNTSNDVQEDTLASFENFLSFGRMALNEDDSRMGTKPFQKLVFLVRDWENHVEYPFGHEGGKRFIERKLQEKSDHDDFHRRLRRHMKSCFDNIDCFLLPHPGLAAREPRFTGSVVNSSSEFRKFAKQIQLCIEQLANPNNFPLKTLNGNVLTAPELASLFKSYVEIFNSDEIPSSNDLFNATAERCNAVVITKCVDVFVKNFESSLSSVQFLSEQDFRSAQEAAEDEAWSAFRNSRKMGDSEAIAAAKAEFKTKLDEKVAYYRVMNYNKQSEARQQYETQLEEILADYETEMEAKVGDDVLYEDDFQAIHNQVASSARQKIQDLQGDTSLEAAGLSALGKRIQNTGIWLHRVKLNRERLENSLLTLMAAAESEYRNSLDPTRFIDVEDLETAESQARSQALETLKHIPQKLSESTMSTAERDLTEKLDVIYSKAVEQLEQICESQRGKLHLAVEEAARGYKASMEAQLSPPARSGTNNEKPVSAEDLEALHTQYESQALTNLSEFFEANAHLFKNPNKLKLESNDKLRSKILQEYANFSRSNDQKIENAKAQLVKLVSKAQQEFTQEIRSLAERAADEKDLNLKASNLKNRIKADLEDQIDKSAIDKSTWSAHLSKLDSHMDTETDMGIVSVRTNRKEAEVKVQSAMVNAATFYSEQMKTARGSKSWFPADEFKKINDQILEDAVRKFTDGTMTTEQIRKLRDSLQNLYLKFEEENESFIPTEAHAIGIDLGTTYSCVGVYVNGKVDIIQENERFTIPSCVYYDENEVRTVGEAAQDGAYMSPENFIFDAKRLIGRNFVDETVQDDINHWSFNVVEKEGQPRIQCRAGILRPEQVSAEVLSHLKSLAEKHLGQTVTKAVVTVPAYFNEGQRQATKDAATMSGLEAKILTEPVAAAIAYRMDRVGDMNKNVLVFDLGGGTFDVAVLNITGGHIDVKTINGDTHLGGEDFDKLLLKHVINKVKTSSGRDLLEGKDSSDPEAKKKVNNLLRRLKTECERRKRELSSTLSARIRLEEVGWTLDEKIMRADFEELINPELEKCMKIVQTALTDAKMSKDDIQDVVLVGGSTKIPRVHEMLKEYFNGIQLKHSVNPDQAVACGAAIQAAIKANTRQGAGVRYRISCQDVTPTSIGIEEAHGKFIVQVPKGTKIPYTYQQYWWPERDNQSSANFVIYEGEDKMARNNRLLGKFVLHLPSSVKKDEGQMESTTMVDDEGILTVKATCLLDGTENDIRIEAYKGRMSQADIQKTREKIQGRQDRLLGPA